MSGKNEQELTFTPADFFKALSVIIVLVVTIVGWSMYEGAQASDIKANTTAIETNKEANNKEQAAQNATIEKLDDTVGALTTAVTELNATLKITLEMIKTRGQ